MSLFEGARPLPALKSFTHWTSTATGSGCLTNIPAYVVEKVARLIMKSSFYTGSLSERCTRYP